FRFVLFFFQLFVLQLFFFVNYIFKRFAIAEVIPVITGTTVKCFVERHVASWYLLPLRACGLLSTATTRLPPLLWITRAQCLSIMHTTAPEHNNLAERTLVKYVAINYQEEVSTRE